MIPKYRAWFVKRQVMVDVGKIEWYEVEDESHMMIHSVKQEGSESGTYYQPFEYTHKTTSLDGRTQIPSVHLMQYTGFKDEKSVGVYEGDIVNVHWFYTAYDEGTLGRYEDEEEAKKVIITKEYGNLGFWWPEADGWIDLSGLALQGGLHEESFERLGNIHENPELLEENTK